MAKKAKQVKPRKEPSAVTIGNLQREVNNLKQRCAELVAQRDGYMAQTRQRDQVIDDRDSVIFGLQGELEMARERIADMEGVCGRMQGWQDCAREILELERSEITVSRPQTLRDAIRRATEQTGK